ncbi:MAG: T9SS type A sorting domain-containing protein, partial [Cytophagaceae bacterium]
YNGTVTTLTSSATTGNQFYYNGVAIAGATGQTYVVNGSATTYGSYTVVVTNSFGCVSQPSVPQVITTTKSGIAGASLQVYPNPTPTGLVTLELSGFRSATQLAVIDALGRVVSAETLPATTGVVTHSLDLSRMASGVYMLRLTNADGVETRRLTRE